MKKAVVVSVLLLAGLIPANADSFSKLTRIVNCYEAVVQEFDYMVIELNRLGDPEVNRILIAHMDKITKLFKETKAANAKDKQ